MWLVWLACGDITGWFPLFLGFAAGFLFMKVYFRLGLYEPATVSGILPWVTLLAGWSPPAAVSSLVSTTLAVEGVSGLLLSVTAPPELLLLLTSASLRLTTPPLTAVTTSPAAADDSLNRWENSSQYSSACLVWDSDHPVSHTRHTANHDVLKRIWNSHH